MPCAQSQITRPKLYSLGARRVVGPLRTENLRPHFRRRTKASRGTSEGHDTVEGANHIEEQEYVDAYDSDDYEQTEEELDRQARQRERSLSARASTARGERLGERLSAARLTDSIVHAYKGARAMLKPSIKRTSARIQRVRERARQIQEELPEDTWGKLLWVWDRPGIQKIRLTFSMVNLSFRLPALVALIVTQGSLLASQVSLPMLAPLLLGTGMMMRSIKTNASFLFPRLGLLVVMLWILWFTNSVIQNTIQYLKKQGALDDRMAGGIITVTEISTLLVASVVLLSMIGVNVSALLLPAGIAVAVAAKDLSHNFLAGFFLFVAQPFKLGDRVAVSSSAPMAGAGGVYGSGGMGAPPGWFEGICEKVDLRYTVVRQGRRKLMVPNSAFLTREFMVLDESYSENSDKDVDGEGRTELLTADNRHVWQYLDSPPIHSELVQGPGNNNNGMMNGAPMMSPQGTPMPGATPPPVQPGMSSQAPQGSRMQPRGSPMADPMSGPPQQPQAYGQVYYYGRSPGYDHSQAMPMQPRAMQPPWGYQDDKRGEQNNN